VFFSLHEPINTEHNSKVKGCLAPKMEILSYFTHPQVVPNLYEFLCSVEHKRIHFEECW